MDIDRTQGQRKLSFDIFPTLAFRKAYRPDSPRTQNVLLFRQNYRNRRTDHNGFWPNAIIGYSLSNFDRALRIFSRLHNADNNRTKTTKQCWNLIANCGRWLSPETDRFGTKKTAKSIDSFSFGRQHMAHLTFPSAIH